MRIILTLQALCSLVKLAGLRADTVGVFLLYFHDVEMIGDDKIFNLLPEMCQSQVIGSLKQRFV